MFVSSHLGRICCWRQGKRKWASVCGRVLICQSCNPSSVCRCCYPTHPARTGPPISEHPLSQRQHGPFSILHSIKLIILSDYLREPGHWKPQSQISLFQHRHREATSLTVRLNVFRIPFKPKGKKNPQSTFNKILPRVHTIPIHGTPQPYLGNE